MTGRDFFAEPYGVHPGEDGYTGRSADGYAADGWHRWIGADGADQCLRCGVAIDSEIDTGWLPPCYGPNVTRGHHFTAAPDGVECVYGDAAIGRETEWHTVRAECVGA